MSGPHIVKAYDKELHLLKSKLTDMGLKAIEQLAKAAEALTRRDSRRAEHVINGDSHMNGLQEEVDQHTARMLAIRQPMAPDLRMIISGLKIGKDLERIAD